MLRAYTKPGWLSGDITPLFLIIPSTGRVFKGMNPEPTLPPGYWGDGSDWQFEEI